MDPKALGQFLMQPSTADVLNTPVRRGGILPVTEYPNRSEFDLSSGLTGALWNAITAPARAARGEISEYQQIPEAFNFAGSLTLGSLLAPRPTGSVGMGGRAAKEALDMSEAARMARAKEMGFDTPFYHVTRNQFDEFKPGSRGASFFAGTESDAARGAAAGQREWTMNTATEPNRAPLRTISALGKSSTIEGLALSPSQKKLFEAMPDKISLDDYQNIWRKRIEDEFGTVPPWLYDDGTVSMPDGRVFSYDDLSKLTDAELDDVRKFGKETLSKGQVPAFSYEDARRTGRDIFGRQIAHWGPTSDEAAIAKRVSDNGMGGYLINDEAGVSVAVTDPRNIRSVNAAFDPEKAHLANLLAANAKTGAAVPLATKALEAQQPQGIRAFHGSPHDFDRFSMEHIGTGEGAQAYGHGLYFADRENVAKMYREKLSAFPDVYMNGKKIKIGDGETPEQLAASAFQSANGDINGAKNWLQKQINGPYLSDDAVKEYQAAFKWIDENGNRLVLQDNPGHMYEVNIRASPEDFLDWDKPLSQQSEKVREAALGIRNKAARAEYEARGFPEPLIQEYLANATRADKTGGQIVKGMKGAGQSADFSQALREAGIPGIRYLDQMSRDFTPPKIKETADGFEVYWGNDPMPVDTFKTRGQAEEVARQFDTRSSNYVVFDDKLIEILRKYGLLGPVAGGGTLAGMLMGGQDGETY